VPRLEACLVDAYDTIVTCDFSIIQNELSALSGISPGTWQVEYARIGALVSDGRISKAEAFARLLRAVGREARPGLVAELVRQDQELLLAHARLYDDAIPFLQRLRDRGIKIAIVSNCAANTRPLLVKHGVDALADTLVLSCEVRSAKPAAEIFRCALDRLGVAAEAAVFVDDQPGYCAGSMAAGIRAVQIVRSELDGHAPAPGTTVVRSLPEVEALFGE
jgi:putative hydrolase of the HAD superfamily